MSTLFTPPVDLGSDTDLLGDLLQVWREKRPRNVERSVYYDGEKALKDFGISLPPQMRNVGAALGWISKGVHGVTDRSRFEGFVSPANTDDPFGLESIMWENRFRIEFPAASISSAVHGCSFLTVTQGDVESGEPEVLVLARAAEDSAAIWDKRKRALKGFLSIVEVGEDGEPSELVMYTPETVYTLTKDLGKWSFEERDNPLGLVSVSPLVHKFELRRPLGHSRITRAAMYYADAALRTIVRSEVSAEFYSAPEYYLFGADVQSFIGDDKWSALMGRIKALDVEDGDDKPDLHRFTGASPQPHVDQLRMWASQFADDQDLEVKFADSANPSSADAIFAAKETLITTTKDANLLWGHGAVEAMQMAVRLRDGLDVVPEELRALSAQFTDPAIVSPSARADAFSKLATNIPGFGATEVGMEFAGLSREQIVRLQAEQKRAQALQLVQGLGVAAGAALNDPGMSSEGQDAAASQPAEDELKQAQILKLNSETVGILRRAGVVAEDAARRAGLEGVKFIPGQPITIKTNDE